MSTSSATPCKMITISGDDAKVQATISSSTTTALSQELKESLFSRFRGLVKAAPMMLFIKKRHLPFSAGSAGRWLKFRMKKGQVWVL